MGSSTTVFRPAPTKAAVGISGRLPGIDGLRAMAALWVVLFHVRAFSGFHSFPIPGVDFVLRSGSTGVSLFLVISGFCLYVPFAGGRLGRFNTWAFLLRRCRRLMPAYYVALSAAAALTLVGAGWLGFSHLTLREAALQVGTHLTLTQTLFPSTFYALNGAYWSLGLEWQLYLALPLLVISIRRFGFTRTLVAAAAVNVVYRLGLEAAIRMGLLQDGSVLATVVLPNQLPGRWAEFVLGMLAAELFKTGRVQVWARWMRVGLIGLVPASVVLVGNPLSHLIFGLVFFALLTVVLAGDNVVSRVFSWRPLVALGVMSYSLYLVHQPLIQCLAYVTQTYAHMSPRASFATLIGLLPFIVTVAFLLFIAVERRTLSSQAATTIDAAEKPVESGPAIMARSSASWAMRPAKSKIE